MAIRCSDSCSVWRLIKDVGRSFDNSELTEADAVLLLHDILLRFENDLQPGITLATSQTHQSIKEAALKRLDRFMKANTSAEEVNRALLEIQNMWRAFMSVGEVELAQELLEKHLPMYLASESLATLVQSGEVKVDDYIVDIDPKVFDEKDMNSVLRECKQAREARPVPQTPPASSSNSRLRVTLTTSSTQRGDDRGVSGRPSSGGVSRVVTIQDYPEDTEEGKRELEEKVDKLTTEVAKLREEKTDASKAASTMSWGDAARSWMPLVGQIVSSGLQAQATASLAAENMTLSHRVAEAMQEARRQRWIGRGEGFVVGNVTGAVGTMFATGTGIFNAGGEVAKHTFRPLGRWAKGKIWDATIGTYV